MFEVNGDSSGLVFEVEFIRTSGHQADVEDYIHLISSVPGHPVPKMYTTLWANMHKALFSVQCGFIQAQDLRRFGNEC